MKLTHFPFLFLFIFSQTILLANNTLHLDGVDDDISISINPFTSNSGMTIELWFFSDNQTQCTGTTPEHILFTIVGGNFVVGECGGALMVNSNIIPLAPNIRDGNWHHLAMITGPTSYNLYLDGFPLPLPFGSGNQSFTPFQGNLNLGQGTWRGQIDELRIWDVPKTTSHFITKKNCQLTGSEFGLVAYYPFDQGDPGEDNSAINTLTDVFNLSGANDGQLLNFNMVGNRSNFIRSYAPVCRVCLFAAQSDPEVTITQVALQGNNQITTIKNGEEFTYKIIFSINQDMNNGIIIKDFLPAHVDYIDGTLSLPNNFFTSSPYDPSTHTFTLVRSGFVPISNSIEVSFKAKYRSGVRPCDNCHNCNLVEINGDNGTNTFMHHDELCLTVEHGPTNYGSLSTACTVEEGEDALYKMQIVASGYPDFIENLAILDHSLKVTVPIGATITNAWWQRGGGASFSSLTIINDPIGSQFYELLPPAGFEDMMFPTFPFEFKYFFTVGHPLIAGNTMNVSADLCYKDNCGMDYTISGSSSSIVMNSPASTGPVMSANLSYHDFWTDVCCANGITFNFETDEAMDRVEIVCPVPDGIRPYQLAVNGPPGSTWTFQTTDINGVQETFNGSYWWGAGYPMTPNGVCNAPLDFATNKQFTEVRFIFENVLPCSKIAVGYTFYINPVHTNTPGNPPIITGETITNCAFAEYYINLGDPVTTTPSVCEDMVVADGDPVRFTDLPPTKTIVSHPDPYQAGDCVTFRIHTSNFGSRDLLGMTITDFLDPCYTSIQNIRYQIVQGGYRLQMPSPQPANWLPSTSTYLSLGVPFTDTQLGTITPNYNTSNNQLTFNLDQFPGTCRGERLIIEYDACIDVACTPGTCIENYFNLSSNDPDFLADHPTGVFPTTTSGKHSQKVNIVEPTTVLDIQKTLMNTLYPGALAEYDITINNNSNSIVKDIVVVDVLPDNGDVKPLTGTPRGSTGSADITTPLNYVSPMFEDYWNTDIDGFSTTPNFNNDDLCNGPTWGTLASSTPVESVKIHLGANEKLYPNGSTAGPSTVTFPIKMSIPVGTPAGTMICNDLVYQARLNSSGVLLLPSQSETVCDIVEPCSGCVLGGWVWDDANNDGQQLGETGFNGLVIELYESPSNTLVTTTVSANDFGNNPGFYQFCGLDAAKTYYVQVVAPAGYNLTNANIGNDATDSDVDPFSLRSGLIPMTSCMEDVDIGVTTGEPCECGGYSDWVVENVTTGSAPTNSMCGGTVMGDCDDTFSVNISQNCFGTNCPPTIDWELKDAPGNLIASGSASTSIFLDFASYGVIAGTYTLTVNSQCGPIDCDICTLDFDLDCDPCECMPGTIELTDGVGTVYNNSCGSTVTVNDCDNPFLIDALGFCNGDPLCPPIYSWVMTSGCGTQTGTILPTSMNLDPLCSPYFFEYYSDCGTANCPPCYLNINVDACPLMVEPDTFVKIVGDTLDDHYNTIKRVGNHLYAAGYSGTAGGFHGIFSKFDITGGLNWTVQIDDESVFNDFVETDNNGSAFLIVGRTDPLQVNGAWQDNESILCKIDNSGSIVWINHYQQEGRENMIKIVRSPAPIDSNFPFYISGVENRSIASPSTLDHVNLYNLDEFGTIKWKYQYTAGSDNEFIRDLVALSNGNIGMFGSTNGPTGYGITIDGDGNEIVDFKINPSFIIRGVVEIQGTTDYYIVGEKRNSSQAFLARIDIQGNQVWSRYMSTQTNFTKIEQAPNSDLYVIGQGNVNGLLRYMVNKFSAIGDYQWTRFIDNGETAFDKGCLDILQEGYIAYSDCRVGNPNGFMNYDALVGIFDLDLTSECRDSFIDTVDSLFIISGNPTLTLVDTLMTTPMVTFAGDQIPFDCDDGCDPCNNVPLTIQCPADVVLNCNLGSCENVFTHSDPIILTQSNCATFTNIVCTRSDGAALTDPYPMGVTTITCVVTDDFGSVTCAYNVTVQDVNPPMAVCQQITVQLDNTTCSVTISPQDIDGGSFDDCQIVNMTLDVSTFTTCGDHPVTFTVEDCGGNINTCNTFVFVEEKVDPVITCPSDITINCTQDPNDTGITGIATATDNCTANPTVTFLDAIDDSDPCNIIITRTWTATDDCGNSDMCTQIIHVIDDIDPVIICPADLSISCDEDPLDTNITGEPTVTDDCSSQIGITFNDFVIGDACAWSIERTWIANDGCGNFASCIQIIDVIDITSPVFTNCPADLTVQGVPDPTGVCSANVDLPLPTAMDDCNGVTLDYVLSIATTGNGTSANTSVVLNQGNTTVTWTATDDCGNVSAVCVYIVTVLPCMSDCPNNIIQNWDFELGTPQIPSDDEDITNATNWGPIWDDQNGTYSTGDFYNTTTALPPSVLTVPTPAAQGQYGGFWVNTTSDPDFREGIMNQLAQPLLPGNENCVLTFELACLIGVSNNPRLAVYAVDAGFGSATITGAATPTNLNMFPTGVNVVQLGFYDIPATCTNNFTTVTINFNSNIIPSPLTHIFFTRADSPPSGGVFVALDDVCLSKLDTCVAFFDWQQIDDCGNIQFTDLSVAETSATITSWDWYIQGGGTFSTLQNPLEQFMPTGTYTVCLDIVTTGGCTSQYCEPIAVTFDATPPLITCPMDVSLLGDPINCEALFTPPPPVIEQSPCITFSDTTYTRSDGLPITAPFPKGITTITCKVTDDFGMDDCTFDVEVTDVTPPMAVCQQISVQLDNTTCSVTISPQDVDGGSTDNCQIVSMTLDVSTFTTCGDHPVTLTVEDCGGNINTCNTFVFVEEKVDPVITCPMDITIDCAQDPNDTSITGMASATDNCTANPTIAFSDAIDNSDPCNIIITRTWTATDACGNSAICTQIINQTDDINPVITCPSDITIDCAQDPNDTSITGMASATDNCTSNPTITFSDAIDDSDPCNIIITRTWTATDDCGNSSTCIQIINQTDNIDPEIVCPADLTLDCTENYNDLSITGTATATDNCDLNVTITHTDQVDNSDPCHIKVLRKWRAEDDCGNLAFCNQLIDLIDNNAPVITNCPVDITVTNGVFDANGNCVATLNLQVPTASDDCNSIAWDYVLSNATIGSGTAANTTVTLNQGTTTVTWTPRDECGNIGSDCIYNITVTECMSNCLITCAPDITLPTDPGDCTAAYIVPPPILTGDCNGCVIDVLTNIPTVFPIGCTTLSWDLVCAGAVVETCSTEVCVEDNEPPVAVCPSDMTISVSSTATSANVFFNTTVNDNCPVAIVTCDYNSGDAFPIGCTTVTCTATDAAGLTNTCSFQICVEQDPACVCDNGLSTGTNLITNNSDFETGVISGFTHDYNPNGTTMLAGDLAVLNSSTLGAANNIWQCLDHTNGATNGFFLAVDGSDTNTDAAWRSPSIPVTAGNTYNFCMYVNNLIPPPGNFQEDPIIEVSINGTIIIPQFLLLESPDDWIQLTGSWIAGNSPAIIEIRTLEIDGTYNDFAIDDISFVECSMPCVMTCAPDITISTDPGECTAVYNVPQPTTTGDCSGCAVVATTLPPLAFPLGCTTLSWVLDCGNPLQQTCSTTICVEDNEPPMITCPPDQSIHVSSAATLVNVSFPNATTTDNCNATVTCDYNSGDAFPIGCTTVTCTATDDAGNTDVCTFDVCVIQDPDCVCDNGSSLSGNLIPNGHFPNTNQWFNSGYTYSTTGQNLNVGEVFIYSNTSLLTLPANPAWYALDHTTGSVDDYFLGVNGSLDNTDAVMDFDVAVNPNSDYNFCMYVDNLKAPGAPPLADPIIEVQINGQVIIGPTTILEVPDQWLQLTGTWSNATGATTANVTIRTVEDAFANNDFAIDDISMVECSANFCPNNLVQNGDFETGPLGDEQISNAANWGGIWNTVNPSPPPSMWSTGDVYNTTSNPPPFSTPTPVSQGQFATFFCSTSSSNSAQREGIMNQLSQTIPQGSGNYTLTFEFACLNGSFGTPRLEVYGVNSPIGSGVITGQATPNASLFTTTTGATPVLLFSNNIPASCNSTFTTLTVPIDANTFPASGIDHIFFTRGDPPGGGIFVAIDDVCLVSDNPMPTCTMVCPPDITVSNDIDQCNAFVNVPTPALTGDCTNCIVTNDFNFTGNASGNYPVGVTTVIWTMSCPGPTPIVTSCTSIVEVLDTQSPTAICTDITVNVNSGSVTIIPSDVGIGNDNCPNWTESIDINTFTCADACQTPVVVTYTVTDASGNSTSCTANVTVEETIPPVMVCPIDRTIDCDDPTVPSFTGMATATDNCTTPSDILITYVDNINNQDPCHIIVKRTWVAEDACGNREKCVQDIDIIDMSPPETISCPNDMTFTGVFDGNMNCVYTMNLPVPSGNDCNSISWSYVLSGATTGSGFAFNTLVTLNQGVTTVTWTPVDECMNVGVDCVYDITVEACDPGCQMTCPADISVPNDKDECGAFVNVPIPSLTGNCSGCYFTHNAPPGTTSLTNASGFYPVGTTVVTWTLVCPGTPFQQQCATSITVTDTQIPDVVCLGLGVDVSNGPVAITPALIGTWSDNCQVVSAVVDVTSVDCSDACGNVPVTLTVTDNNGNVNSCTVNVQVIEGIPPVMTCPADVTLDCNDPWGNVSLGGTPTVTDNCDPNPTVTHFDLISLGTDFCNIEIERKWTATDDCGNFTTCTQMITLTDTTDPIITFCPPDVTVSCNEDYHPSDVGTAVATDDCDFNLTITYSDNIPNPNLCDQDVIRTWTAEDNCGNTATCVQIINVVDDTPPIITNCPADFTVQGTVDGMGNCTATLSIPIPTGDDCNLWFFTHSMSGATFGSGIFNNPVTLNAGITTVSFNAIDLCGNVAPAVCTYNIDVQCLMFCPNNIVQNGNFELGTPDGTDESINLATNWGGIWNLSNPNPPPLNFSSGDFYNTTTNQPPSSVLTPTPVTQGQFATMWVSNTTSSNEFREGIMNRLAFPLLPGNDNCQLSFQIACLAGSGNPTLDIYGVNAPGGFNSGTITNSSIPQNPNIFNNGSVVLLASFVIPPTCNNGFTPVNLNFNSGTIPQGGIDHIFFTRSDANTIGNQFIAIDDVCLAKPDNCVADFNPLVLQNCGDVQFVDQSTSITNIVSWTWSEPSVGIFSNQQHPFVQYQTSGQHTICLDIITASGCTSQFCDVINVTVDNIAPTVLCPATATINCTDNINDLNLTGNATANDNSDPSPVLTYYDIPSFGNCNSLVQRVWTATDFCQNVSLPCTQLITIVDDTPPVVGQLVCPNITVQGQAAGIFGCGKVVSVTAPAAFDLCDPNPVVSYSTTGATILNGTGNISTFFFAGTTNITWIATDNCGNQAIICSSQVVVDPCAPCTIDCVDPYVIVPNKIGECDAFVIVPQPILSGTCAGCVVTHDSPYSTDPNDASGIYPVGCTTVNWTSSGCFINDVNCSILVCVEELEPPVINCPTDMTVTDIGGNGGTTATWNLPVATDNCPLNITSTHNPGDFFPCGKTTVTYTIVESFTGVIHTCTFDVTVICIGNTCSPCPNNIVQNSGFQNGAVLGSMPFGTTNSWSNPIPLANSNSPQVIGNDYCGDPVSIQMWGYQDWGEAITQTGVNFQKDVTYSISFCARFFDHPNFNTTDVQFGFTASNGSVNPFTDANKNNIGATAPITDTDWACYTLPDWTPSQNYTDLVINVFNNQTSVNNSTWGRIDNICIQPIGGQVCDAEFTWAELGSPFCGIVDFTDQSTTLLPPIFNWDWTVYLNGQQIATANTQNFTYTFPHSGTYDVCLSIDDQSGCTDFECQTITINFPDDPPPIQCPANQMYFADAGTCFSNTDPPTGFITGFNLCTPPQPVVCTRDDGLGITDPYPIGVTTITCVATNDFGSSICVYTVTVLDQCPSTFTATPINAPFFCGEYQFNSDATGNCVYQWTFGDGPTSTDANPTHTYAPGTYQVCLTAGAGADCITTTCQTITVSYGFKPSINCPVSTTVDADLGDCATTLPNPQTVIAHNICAQNVQDVCVRSDGLAFSDPYPVGVTTVTCTASDNFGSTSCFYTVTVEDNEPPISPCPIPDITVSVPQGSTSGVATWTYTLDDNCGANTVGIINESHPSGSTFPLGCTTVSVTAQDGYGNTTPCTFQVCVEEECPMDCNDFQTDVDAGFLPPIVTYGNPCIRTFIPIALSPCDQVNWTLTSSDPIITGTSTGNNPIIFTLNDGINYKITMSVTRTLPDGTVCQPAPYEFIDAYYIPLCTPFICAPGVIANGGFQNGLESWSVDAGNPIVESGMGCDDEGFITLSGNREEADIISHDVSGLPSSDDNDFYISVCLNPDETTLKSGTRLIVRTSNTPQNMVDCDGGNCDVIGIIDIGDGGGNDFVAQDPMFTKYMFNSLIFHIENDEDDDGTPDSRSVVSIDNVCIEIIDTTSTQDFFDLDVKIFPNPTDQDVFIQFSRSLDEDMDYQLVDLWGRTIQLGTFEKGYLSHSIQMNTLPDGVYIFEMGNEEKGYYRERIVKHTP